MGEQIASSGVAFEDAIEKRELTKLALELVSPRLREAMLLYYLKGYSHADIADVLGIRQASVAAYISEGQRQLRKVYSQLMNEEELTGGSATSQRHKLPDSSKQQDYTENISKSTQSIIAVEASVNEDEDEKVSLDKTRRSAGSQRRATQAIHPKRRAYRNSNRTDSPH